MRKETIQSLKAEIKKLKKLAYYDELTGLMNRRGFKESAEKFLRQISREREGRRKKVTLNFFSVALIDLDHFKKINDTYGHDAGDVALKHISKIILERVRDIDIVGRWGGEEIVVGLVGAEENDAEFVINSIRERLAKTPMIFHRQKINFTLSAGISYFMEDASLNEIIDRADKALYKAKHSGRNKVIKYSDL